MYDLYLKVFTDNLRSVYMSTLVNVPYVLTISSVCWRWPGRYWLFGLTQEPMNSLDARLASQQSAQQLSGSNASAHSCACKYSVYEIHEAPPSFPCMQNNNIRKITELITEILRKENRKKMIEVNTKFYKIRMHVNIRSK